MGVVFSNYSLNSLRIGVIDILRPSFVRIFKYWQEAFDITYLTKQQTQRADPQNDMHACILFDENFRLDGQKRSLLYIYADYSRINLYGSHQFCLLFAREHFAKEACLLSEFLTRSRTMTADWMWIQKDRFCCDECRRYFIQIQYSSRNGFPRLGRMFQSLITWWISAQIDSFKTNQVYISEDMSKESMDNFSSLIKDKRQTFEYRSEVVIWKKIWVQRRAMHWPEIICLQKDICIAAMNVSELKTWIRYESDAYLKCRKVEDLDVNLQQFMTQFRLLHNKPDLWYDWRENRVHWPPGTELDSMIGSIRKIILILTILWFMLMIFGRVWY